MSSFMVRVISCNNPMGHNSGTFLNNQHRKIQWKPKSVMHLISIKLGYPIYVMHTQITTSNMASFFQSLQVLFFASLILVPHGHSVSFTPIVRHLPHIFHHFTPPHPSPSDNKIDPLYASSPRPYKPPTDSKPPYHRKIPADKIHI